MSLLVGAESSKRFFVWVRNDDTIGCSLSYPLPFTGADGSETTFRVVGQFDSWEDVRKLVLRLHGERGL